MKNKTEKDPLTMPGSSDDPGVAFNRLCDIMVKLRADDGCPWDVEQTPTSLKPYILEEAYEVLEAIDQGDAEKICEELGDLLLQVVFQAQIFSEQQDFSMADVAHSISDKLIRRHPHVFAEATVDNPAELHRQWDAIKKAEQQSNGQSPSVLAGIPTTMPALMRAQKMTSRAKRHDYSFVNDKEPAQILRDQLNRLDQAIAANNPEQIHHDLGEMLFAAANLARHLNGDAELALFDAGNRFQQAFETGPDPTTLDQHKSR